MSTPTDPYELTREIGRLHFGTQSTSGWYGAGANRVAWAASPRAPGEDYDATRERVLGILASRTDLGGSGPQITNALNERLLTVVAWSAAPEAV